MSLAGGTIICGRLCDVFRLDLLGCKVLYDALFTVVAPRVFSFHCGDFFHLVGFCHGFSFGEDMSAFAGSGGDGGGVASFRALARVASRIARPFFAGCAIRVAARVLSGRSSSFSENFRHLRVWSNLPGFRGVPSGTKSLP